MSETVSTRTGAFAGPAARVRRAHPLPIGYGLLIGLMVSIALWVGLAVGIARLFA